MQNTRMSYSANQIPFSLLFQLEDGKDFLTVYEGGSNQGQLVETLTGKKNENYIISISRNQMYVIFISNGEITNKGFFARILESMC